MKIKNLLFILPILFVGCQDVRIESSETLKEKAVIITLIHSPSEHHTDLTQTAFKTGVMGTDFDGNTGIHVGGGMQITSTTIPEKFGVAFQCKHGTFTIEGSETKHQVLYNKLMKNVGDTINILYQEQYRVVYEENKEGKKVVTSRELYKLDFIDAQF